VANRRLGKTGSTKDQSYLLHEEERQTEAGSCHILGGIRRLPTAEDRVRSEVRSCGICGGQSGSGIGFLLVPRFPLPFLIPPTVTHPLSSYHRRYIVSILRASLDNKLKESARQLRRVQDSAAKYAISIK
jgi:hypothetical protein